jgi:DNA repair exonuclease SbcCD ATPase subunit
VLFDEPGKMISKEYLPNVAEFLKQYAKKTGRQIILVTHHEALADVADVGYKVTQENGVSEVTRSV